MMNTPRWQKVAMVTALLAFGGGVALGQSDLDDNIYSPEIDFYDAYGADEDDPVDVKLPGRVEAPQVKTTTAVRTEDDRPLCVCVCGSDGTAEATTTRGAEPPDYDVDVEEFAPDVLTGDDEIEPLGR